MVIRVNVTVLMLYVVDEMGDVKTTERQRGRTARLLSNVGLTAEAPQNPQVFLMPMRTYSNVCIASGTFYHVDNSKHLA